MAGNHGRSATMVDIGGALAATRVQRQALGSRSHVIPEGSLVPVAMRGYTLALVPSNEEARSLHYNKLRVNRTAKYPL